MNENIVTEVPTNESIDKRVELNGAMIFMKSTAEERGPIYEYGRYLLARIEPTPGCTLRFYAALRDLAPRLPDYQALIDQTALYPAAMSRFQARLAVYVARNEHFSVVLR